MILPLTILQTETWVSRQMPMEMEIMLFSMPQIMPPIWGEIMPNYALIVELCRIVL